MDLRRGGQEYGSGIQLPQVPPGCCENCSMYDGAVCSRTGEEKYELDVCSEYDPSGSL
ncbi:MAG: hypothetical protein J6U12_05355 [Candidatus Methanomethylophilaceae archaeon]|nr:hypothetical protein [Candidatus Methanomethylophilaceae archaeon]